MLWGFLSKVVLILVIGIVVEKVMEKKGKGGEVKNINYYTKKGNPLPLAIVKAVLYGYYWFFKTYLKVFFTFILGMFGYSGQQSEEEELEEMMAYLAMQEAAAEEERVRQEQYNRSRHL